LVLEPGGEVGCCSCVGKGDGFVEKLAKGGDGVGVDVGDSGAEIGKRGFGDF
jgi:hypothetical protein